MPVDEVEIIPINNLPLISGATLNTNVAMSNPGDPNSKRGPMSLLASIISEQIGSVTVPDPYFYRVDGGGAHDPASIVSGVPNRVAADPTLSGLDYSLFKWGVGPLRKGVEWQNDVSGGGWRLIDADLLPSEMYVAFPKPEVSNILAAPDAIARFTSGVVDITSNIVIGAGNYRKLLNIKGATSVTLPLCSSYPPNVLLAIVTSDGPQKQVTISRQGSDIIDNNGSGITSVILGNREFLQLITDGAKWYIVDVSAAAFKDPSFEMGYFSGLTGTNIVGLNQIPALGGVFNRSDYPRVVRFLNKLKAVNPAFVKSSSEWTTNRTFWGDGDGINTFQAPDLGGYFPRFLEGGTGPYVDPARQSAGLNTVPSSVQDSVNKAHSHVLQFRDGSDSVGGAGYIVTSGNPSGPGFVTIPNAPGQPNPAVLSDGDPVEARPINAGFFPIFNI